MTTPDAWLDTFARLVREGDVDAARALFHPDVRSFGTRAEQAVGIDDLVARQWALIWSSTEGFEVAVDERWAWRAADSSLEVMAVRWTSTGFGTDGAPYPRRGRATIVLAPDDRAPTGWVAVHTHFSEAPSAGAGPAPGA